MMKFTLTRSSVLALVLATAFATACGKETKENKVPGEGEAPVTSPEGAPNSEVPPGQTVTGGGANGTGGGAGGGAGGSGFTDTVSPFKAALNGKYRSTAVRCTSGRDDNIGLAENPPSFEYTFDFAASPEAHKRKLNNREGALGVVVTSAVSEEAAYKAKADFSYSSASGEARQAKDVALTLAKSGAKKLVLQVSEPSFGCPYDSLTIELSAVSQ